MRTKVIVAAICLGILLGATAACPGAATKAAEDPRSQGSVAEMQLGEAWSAALGSSGRAGAAPGSKLLARPIGRPFSFLYGSRKSAELLPGWQVAVASRVLDALRTEEVVRCADPKTGLRMKLVVVRYKDFPAVEWTMHFHNAAAVDSPLLEDVWPLDAILPLAGSGKAPVLHYAKGAVCSIDDFAPVEKTLEPGTRVELEPGGGRSSSEFLPFLNLDAGGEGVVVAIGWTGQWRAALGRDAGDRLSVRAGMASTRLKLRPGEEIRTPKILTLFWQGERMRGNNLLRRFLLAHHRPHPGGKPLVLPVLVGSWGAPRPPTT